jgi:hypothetical protein
MTLRLQICRDSCGGWSVFGLSPQPAKKFPSLSASVDYARRECGAVPATIEVMAGGCWAVVHQQEGWPRQVVGPDAKRSKRKGGDPGEAPEERRDRSPRRRLARWRHWLSGP